MLEIRDLIVGYGKDKVVLRGINLIVHRGEMAVVMGHNGAGKTTMLKTIFGLLQPTSGEIRFKGQPLSPTASGRVKQGVSFCAAGSAIFPNLTVLENLEVAARVVGLLSTEIDEREELIFELFPILKERLGYRAGSLSGGQRRMLSIGMALIQGPKLLLLDEPSLGIAPLFVERLYAAISDIRQRLNITVLVVEQNINATVLQADKLNILRMGQMVFSGDSKVLHDKEALWNLL